MNSKIEQDLYRIIRGCLRLNVDGLVLFFIEPKSDLILASYDVYNDAYDKAYYNSSLTQVDIDNLLIEFDVWSPYHEKQLTDKQKELEDVKVEAFESFYKTRELAQIKRKIMAINKTLDNMLMAKHSFDHLGCESVAENTRLSWLIAKSVQPSVGFDTQNLLNAYKNQLLSQKDIRQCAKLDTWKSMWFAHKKGSPLFNGLVIDYSRDQLSLLGYSSMYDSVYEHPECPDDKVIDDDDCLDGWFIYQRRKREKDKKARESEQLLKNSKIRNAGEVFIVTSKDNAESVYSLNDGRSRNTIAERNNVIQNKGTVKDIDFADVRQELEMQKTALIRDNIRNKK